jgi:hypothetical protein
MPARDFEETSVQRMIILSVITLGLYNIIWFLLRKKRLDLLGTRDRLRNGSICFCFQAYILMVIAAGSALLAILNPGQLPPDQAQSAAALFGLLALCCLGIYVSMVVRLSVKVRRILNEYFNGTLNIA